MTVLTTCCKATVFVKHETEFPIGDTWEIKTVAPACEGCGEEHPETAQYCDNCGEHKAVAFDTGLGDLCQRCADEYVKELAN